jgi:hypothetical protein
MTPKGRDEDGLAHTMAWVRHHDRYDSSYQVDASAPYQPPKVSTGQQKSATDNCCHEKS